MTWSHNSLPYNEASLSHRHFPNFCPPHRVLPAPFEWVLGPQPHLVQPWLLHQNLYTALFSYWTDTVAAPEPVPIATGWVPVATDAVALSEVLPWGLSSIWNGCCCCVAVALWCWMFLLCFLLVFPTIQSFWRGLKIEWLALNLIIKGAIPKVNSHGLFREITNLSKK